MKILKRKNAINFLFDRTDGTDFIKIPISDVIKKADKKYKIKYSKENK